jgi:hypothetical protein
MKKIIILGLVLPVIFIVISACDNMIESSLSSKPTDSESRYMLKLSNGNEASLNVQYVRTEYFYNEEIPFPAFVEIVSSKNELEQYYQNHKRMIWDTKGNVLPEQNFLDAIEKYSENYFSDNFLLIVGLTESSGSIRHKVEIDSNGDIVINRLLPDIGTTDMAAWSLIMELNNSFKVEQYQIKL